MLNRLPLDLLVCPVCKSKLDIDAPNFDQQNKTITCSSKDCQTSFPVINDIPCLINESNSVFSFDDFVKQKDLFFKLSEASSFKQTIRKFIPSISKNYSSKTNYRKIRDHLISNIKTPKVLVLGGSILGDGLKSIISTPNMTFIETDVSFGPRTMLICDAHDIPFQDESFDWVIVQAVLEHVVDPERCLEEIRRVLKFGGLVYAETAFMQQIHGREFDFMRFTFLGHRRLFRHFEEMESGIVCGPGMALAWAYKYFLLSFFKSKLLRKIANIFADLTAFYLKYFDRYLIHKYPAYDAASGFYFLGKKSGSILTNKELITQYKGGF